MCEILFRGKRADNGEWVFGSYVIQYGAHEIYLPDGVDSENVFDRYHVIPETVVQYTGLTDKNGRKIFEGDIIKCKVYEMNGYRVRRGVVEYHGVGFIMNLDPNSWYDQKNISFDCEVIGNIYDNPELLKGGVENG